VGRATCRALARSGCDIDLTYCQSADEAQVVAEELRAMGADVEALALDLDDLASVDQFAERYGSGGRELDVLVQNASAYTPTALADVTADEAMRFYRINALAPLVLSRGVSAALAASVMDGGGSIVAMCDIHAMGRPRRSFAAYGMSKAALGEMVHILALELAPEVRVNGVAPGVVAFPERGYESDPEMQARYLKRVPMERSGRPEDAAEAVRWLALDARYTTGEIVRVDGGRFLT
jgi:pteridine reductase